MHRSRSNGNDFQSWAEHTLRTSSAFRRMSGPVTLSKAYLLPMKAVRAFMPATCLSILHLKIVTKPYTTRIVFFERGEYFRLVVPDLERRTREYISRLDRGESDANAFFLRSTYLGSEIKPHGLAGIARKLFNTSAHLWMWDEKSMTQALKDHGFCEIRRSRFGDCEDSKFSLVENQSRFENEVAIEARRL